MSLSPQMMNLTVRLSEMMPPDKLTVARNRDYNSYRRDSVWSFIAVVIMVVGVANHQMHYDFKIIGWIVAALSWVHAISGVGASVFLIGASILVPFVVSRRYAKDTKERKQSLAGLKKTMLRYRIHVAQIAMNLLWVTMMFYAGHHILAAVSLGTTLFLHVSLILGCYLGPRWINV